MKRVVRTVLLTFVLSGSLPASALTLDEYCRYWVDNAQNMYNDAAVHGSDQVLYNNYVAVQHGRLTQKLVADELRRAMYAANNAVPLQDYLAQESKNCVTAYQVVQSLSISY
jgi:hypothetical protein